MRQARSIAREGDERAYQERGRQWIRFACVRYSKWRKTAAGYPAPRQRIDPALRQNRYIRGNPYSALI